MKVIFLGTAANNSSIITGGTRVSKRNLDMLCQVFGKENVVTIPIFEKKPSKIEILYRLLFSRFHKMGKKKKERIFDFIEKEEAQFVYLDVSILGELAKEIKHHYPDVKIVSFFHNVEYNYNSIMSLSMKGIRKRINMLSLKSIFNSEFLTCKYSDLIMSLNRRDAEQIAKFYQREPDVLAPVCLKDDFKQEYVRVLNNEKPIGLMVGNNFPPNANGLEWFVKSVLPYVDMKLVVVGSNMDKLAPKYNGFSNIEIHGFVEDLNEYYAMADYMICPIFEGAGMKVKTAEALEFGKFIFAGPEAVVGYEYTGNEICVCENAEEFIRNINNFKRPEGWNGFVPSSRNLYLNNYSYERSYEIFKGAFEQLLNSFCIVC